MGYHNVYDHTALIAEAIHDASAKETPVDADEWALIDTEDSNALKKVSGTHKKAYLKTYFDGLYLAKAAAVFSAATELTISSGEVTATQSVHTIDGEGDAADDLDTINGGSAEQLLLIRPASADRDITLKHGTGNIITPSGNDYAMPDNGLVMLHYDGANWRIIAPGSGGSISEVVDDTSPQLGGDLDINEKSIQYEFGTLADDHTASGDIFTSTAGENLVFGEVCYYKSDGKWWKTDADAVATSKGMMAMAIATIAADASGLFLGRGLARDDTWDWTTADELFLDTATAGGMTATAPSGDGDIVRLVGYAKAADYVWFDPSKTYIEITAA